MINNLSNADILRLWQSPSYKKADIGIFYIVNKYLLNKKLDEDDQFIKNVMDVLKLNFNKFHKFLVEYINRLSSLLFLNNNKLTDSIILYRGEGRKKFDHKVGDILTYNTFHSTTTKIELAAGFSHIHTSKKFKRILFCIKYNAGAYCKKLTTKMSYYDSFTKVHVNINEFEYLVPPNSYYCITDINNSNGIIFVKMRLILQDHSILTTDSFYKNKLINKTCKNFNDTAINKFIGKLEDDKLNYKHLRKMKKYHINEALYDVLTSYAHRGIFGMDLDKAKSIILKFKSKYDPKNNKNILKLIKKLYEIGLRVARHTDIIFTKDYYKYIVSRYKSILKLNINKFKSISKTLYVGYHNVDLAMDKYEFVNELNNNNGTFNNYDKILIAQLTNKCFLYDCADEFEPTVGLKKNDKSINQYYQHIIKLKLYDVKIAVCKIQKYPHQNSIIILPPFLWKLNKKTKKVNKFGKTIYFYDIELFTDTK
jgi:hypothetical protein